MKATIKNAAAKLAGAVNKNLRQHFTKVHKVRWAWLAMLPVVGIALIMIFEWHFVQHLLLAMGIEAVLHHIGAAAISEAENVAETAVETAVTAVAEVL